MKLQYEIGDIVTIRRVEELSALDFGGDEIYNELLDAQELQEEFKIIADTCGDGSYFDIQNVTTGKYFDAVSAHHFLPVNQAAAQFLLAMGQ